jgi:hypothetical protein
VSYGELDNLFVQFFALVEATVRLPPGIDRRSAFRDVRNYGSRIDQIAVRLLKQRPDLKRTSLESLATFESQRD